nr:phospholipase D-like domain-containing protein [Pseudohalocynthiibacter aestuariivivens]
MKPQTEQQEDKSEVGAPVTSLKIMLTAQEAYPVLERAFLNARTEINAGFRVFDPGTPLYSDEAREIGCDWFDLLVHTLRRGVSIRFVISDFDPIGAPHLHRLSSRTRRQMIAAQELAGAGTLETVMDMHAARVGLLPRLLFYPIARKRLGDLVRWINGLSLAPRRRFMQDATRLRGLTKFDGQEVRCAPGLPNLYPASHHQKLAVFDRETLYIGGLDLNERRYDTLQHARSAEDTWYDLQVLACGPVVTAANAHLNNFIDVISGAKPPSPAVPGFLRTLSSGRVGSIIYMSPRTRVREIEDAHLRHISKAEDLIYLETQFFRQVKLARALAKRAKACPNLRLILILPAAPQGAAFSGHMGSDVKFGEYLQTRCLRILRRAFGADRLIVASPVQQRADDSDGRDTLAGSPLIYVHAKLSIFDDHAAIVSSANLNGRSMRWDTEAGLELTNAAHVGALTNRAMRHWVPDTGDGNHAARFEHWATVVAANAKAAPEDRNGFLVPYDAAPARDAAMAVPGMPDELV